jgi:hypothetical protein
MIEEGKKLADAGWLLAGCWLPESFASFDHPSSVEHTF